MNIDDLVQPNMAELAKRNFHSSLNKRVAASGLSIVKFKTLPKMTKEAMNCIEAVITNCKGVMKITEVLNDLAYTATNQCYTDNADNVANNLLALPLGDTKFYFSDLDDLDPIVKLLKAGKAAGDRKWGQRGATEPMSAEDIRAEAMSIANVGQNNVRLLFEGRQLESKDYRMIRSVLTEINDPALRHLLNNAAGKESQGGVNSNHMDYMMMMAYLKERKGDKKGVMQIKQAGVYVMSRSSKALKDKLPYVYRQSYDVCLKVLNHCRLGECDPRMVPAYAMTTIKCHRVIMLTAVHLGQDLTVTSLDDLSFTTSPGAAMQLLYGIYHEFVVNFDDSEVFKLGQIARNGLNGVQVNFNYCTGGLMKTIPGRPTNKVYVCMEENGTTSCRNPTNPAGVLSKLCRETPVTNQM
jgi:hypothetical protein